MSGFDSKSRHSATRRRSPPEELLNAPIVRRAAQRVHRHLDAAVDVPRIGRIDLLLQLGHLLHQFIGIVLADFHADFVEAVDQLLLVAPALDVLAHV
ncbi:MAG: hypothetical protein R3C16_09570 [Hyphomonadaceae bacterium]